MTTAKWIARACFVTSLGFGSAVGAVSPSPGVLAATKAKYRSTMAREHARAIAAETIINDLDFFLRVFGHLQDLIQTDEGDHTAQRHSMAQQHLQEAISNLARSRHDGALGGVSLDEQLAMAISQRQFVAARYFINEARDFSESSWLAEQIQRHSKFVKDDSDALKRKIESFNAAIDACRELSEQSKAEAARLEQQAANLFGSATRREELTEQAVIDLKALRTQMALLQGKLQATKNGLIHRRSELERDLQIQNHFVSVREFIEQIIAEYELKLCLTQAFNEGTGLPHLAQIPLEHPLTATLTQWRLLDTPLQPTILSPPVARRTEIRSPVAQQPSRFNLFFFGTK